MLFFRRHRNTALRPVRSVQPVSLQSSGRDTITLTKSHVSSRMSFGFYIIKVTSKCQNSHGILLFSCFYRIFIWMSISTVLLSRSHLTPARWLLPYTRVTWTLLSSDFKEIHWKGRTHNRLVRLCCSRYIIFFFFFYQKHPDWVHSTSHKYHIRLGANNISFKLQLPHLCLSHDQGQVCT